MPLIIIQSHEAHTARLSVDANGVEFLSYLGVLDRQMNVQLAGCETPFPTNGFVRIRRGADFTDSNERIVDEFRYEKESEDSDTGERVPEKWLVYLQLEENAFDRLVQRLHWGIPELHLSFHHLGEIVTFSSSPDWRDLRFVTESRPWEKISEARFIQTPFSAA